MQGQRKSFHDFAEAVAPQVTAYPGFSGFGVGC